MLFDKNYFCETHKKTIICRYNCQRFAHIAKHCRGKRCCQNCGENHEDKNCKNKLYCVNCNKEGHSSSSRNFPKYHSSSKTSKMKLLQLNINSRNTSVDELWNYERLNNYDAIFLQETNYTAHKPLGNFKHWKNKFHTTYTNKNAGVRVGTLIPISTKNVFRDDYTSKNLEMIWNQISIQNKDVLIGNIYITSGNENQLQILDKELEKHQGKNIIILLGDFNSRSNTWDKNIQQSSKMGQLLEDIINRHGFYIATELPYTFKRLDNTGKSTVDLTFVRGLQNIKIQAKEFDFIKTGHQAIKILIEDTQNNSINQPKFKTKNADWKQ